MRRPRHELLLLALVAVAALGTVNLINVQDQSRFCLTDALLHARLTVDGCIGSAVDRSRYGGHLYSNKAPGMSLLALPAAVAVGYRPTPQLHQFVGGRLWLVRLFACGLPFLLAAFLVGRAGETLVPRAGGASLVTFALGSLATPFAVVGFDHAPAAAFGFAAFVAAWRRRPSLAGLAAGAAVLCEYEVAPVVALVAVYVALQGWRSLGRFAAGAAPGATLLAVYDWAAFGAPWRTPLPYSDNAYRDVHRSGILGVHLPNLHSTALVFAGPGGLLVLSPVVLAASLGLWLLYRAGLRIEAALCAAVTVLFVLAECGYGDPYGGDSPLPRYLIPALPFLSVGLAAAFGRFRAVTTVLAAASVAACTTVALTWTVHWHYPGGVWSVLYHAPGDGPYSWLVMHLCPSVLGRPGPLVAAVATVAAFVVAIRGENAAWHFRSSSRTARRPTAIRSSRTQA